MFSSPNKNLDQNLESDMELPRSETSWDYIFREYDTFWGYQQTIEDTYWVRGHIIGTMLQEEDLEPGSGAAEMVTNMVNATEFENLGIGCTGILTGGKAFLRRQQILLVSESLAGENIVLLS